MASHVRNAGRTASVHRFRNLVALYVPGLDETVYLSHQEAGKLARALNKAARSVRSETFLNSQVGTLEIPLARTDQYRSFDA